MVFLRLHRRFTAWLALLALVLGALAPTLTQAMVRGSDLGGERDGWLRICSVSGMVWVQADPASPGEPASTNSAPPGDAAQHCAWCKLHGGATGLPAAELPAGPPIRGSERPAAFFAQPTVAAVWTPAQSRAPPRAS